MGIVHSLIHEKIAVITNELIAQSAQWFTRGTVQQRKLLHMIHQQMKDDPELYKLFARGRKNTKVMNMILMLLVNCMKWSR